MPSVMGLLEERERTARQRVEALQAELREAEAVWERFVIARETVSEVLAGPREPGVVEAAPAAPPAVTGPEAGGAKAVPGSVVPVRRDGVKVTALAPDYQRIMKVLADRERSDAGPMDCRQIAGALGLEVVPAKVEGVRSKAKRLVARGWLAEDAPGMFRVADGRGGGS
ncbi:hypothetical protein ACFWIQ_09585 [Kitasatospora sp. NPDC127059]|uniref:hypothetical protein n=1 Tax=unclassified Kitasatospora TaxID=2633591 RepID=UPI003666A6B0